MKSHYKRIGDYVTQIKLKNIDGAISLLKGININKHFMPSVANIIGTDLSKYRVVKKNQFAFNPMHVGRDEVLPISMLEGDTPIIVSPAYVVFKVKDEKQLLPEYLMMWCRRSDFDRNAWFMTDNSVRGGFSWLDFCDMEMPIPSIEKQHEIVHEYNVVNDRIALNEHITQNLETTARTIYKQWFIDFEFPISKEYAQSIGKPELEGKPYKSSGGEMNVDIEKNISYPIIWTITELKELVDITRGASPRPIQNFFRSEGVPWVKIADASESPTKYLMKTKQFISIEGAKKSRLVSVGDLIVSNSATPGVPMFMGINACVHDGWLLFKNYNGITKEFLYYLIENKRQLLLMSANGSIFKNLKTDILKSLQVYKTDIEFMICISKVFSSINNSVYKNSLEHRALIELRSVILSRLAKG